MAAAAARCPVDTGRPAAPTGATWIENSPNEIARLQADQARQQRVARLCAVRAAAKQEAAARRQKARAAVAEQWSEILSAEESRWREAQQREVERLRAEWLASESAFGRAHLDAMQGEHQYDVRLQQERAAWTARAHLENGRSTDAAAAMDAATLTRMAPRLTRLAHQSQAREAADVRARQVVAAWQRAAPLRATAPQNALDADAATPGRTVPRERRHPFSYDDSHFHRDYLVVRAEPGVPARNAAEAAAAAAAATARQQARQQARAAAAAQRTAARYADAAAADAMQRARDQMLRDLEQIARMDRARRNTATRALAHAKPANRPAELETVFERTFHPRSSWPP
ncbi:hypothetical protein CXG81DRAFT_26190 [Caulochytrium protostelioides]|uniref:Uncharacterized protein n=1 Tax=Caulochytrium protostelioides TaxID=1555241 RepID=A0A4P9X830_9FUNG|nr:hypothetical protein CXG81DRAFT_26190 [Caulochytrium protostelioides]|eukprot:RKP01131.1 hypothetical protein CXG81DRAFT_26190 [Caulochytrium protostelioides]